MYTLHKINSKLITSLNIKCKTINKTPRSNVGENLDDLGSGNYFLDMMGVQCTREAIGKIDFIKIKTSAL